MLPSLAFFGSNNPIQLHHHLFLALMLVGSIALEHIISFQNDILTPHCFALNTYYLNTCPLTLGPQLSVRENRDEVLCYAITLVQIEYFS